MSMIDAPARIRRFTLVCPSHYTVYSSGTVTIIIEF